MPRKCIFGCTNTGVAYHVFPSVNKFPEQFSAWVRSVGGSLDGPTDYEYYKKKRVCDLHFKLSDRNRCNRLNALAVPSPLVHNDDHTEGSNHEDVTDDEHESEDPLYLQLDLDYDENTNDQQKSDTLDLQNEIPKLQPSTPSRPVKTKIWDTGATLDDHDYITSEKKSCTVQNLRTKVVFEPRGLIPPVFTPLNEDLTVNYKEISSYADYMVVNGIKAVLVGGTTGEHMSLSVSDRKKIIEAWVKTKPRSGLHIMVQVGGAPMADVLELAKFCASANVDSLLTLPELYFKPKTVTELVNYVELVSKAAPNLPVLYYHIPSMSKVEINMPAFVTEATSKIPNFKGIKFTSNDLSEGVQVKRNLKEDQEVFLGADTLLAPAALLGIKSSIGTSFNLFPKLAQNILGAVENGDVKKANSLQRTLSLAIEAHLPEGDWVPIMKFGMEIASGLTMGPPALPQQPISTESRNRIVARLKLLKMIE
ncbi:N-acetylneuraminate lyase-like isoform X1 [Pieris napi]|uniref:N-acetylneuraminate lyase-like isoform X1 n=1 Tax=Pieris napi TaxID=78633 RepID=UPI001FB9CA9E|nr:N-acetylneuraminate lyase-like isoform X1 [Pieris napi]